jgi:hypothetical protein
MCGCLQPICKLFFAHVPAGDCHHGLIVINSSKKKPFAALQRRQTPLACERGLPFALAGIIAA